MALLVLDCFGEVCQFVLVIFDLLVVLLAQTGLLADVGLIVVETLTVLFAVELVHLALPLYAAFTDAVVLLAALLQSACAALLVLPRQSAQFTFLRFPDCSVSVFELATGLFDVALVFEAGLSVTLLLVLDFAQAQCLHFALLSR
jgi:hypothetical protein